MRITVLTLAILGVVLFGVVGVATEDPLLGFPGDRTKQQRALEAQFDAELRADNLRQWMKRLTERPHHVGSPYGKEVAEFLAEQFRAWGYDTEIEVFHVLFPTPLSRRLEMVSPTRFVATLEEPTLPEDATSGQKAEQLPTYNVYSIDGDVTEELVYVNYGTPDDYRELERLGVDVSGKIVIARYGGAWRGIKPKVAAEHGAIGCIIYSDPHDDGYGRGDVYPNGAYRMSGGVQRGSVADMPLFPGDPLTPFTGATEDAARLNRSEAPTLTKIPVLPISYADARPLLEALAGPVVPASWRGGLPLTYHVGPGPARVHLELAFDWKLEPIYDVIAKLEGQEFPDEWVIHGNHHDAWVNGAADPISGMVALMEEARAIGLLAANGWRPKRTIVFAAWDGEEPGLLGSTEWAELHAELLADQAVAYINTDGNVRRFLNMGGSHTLERFMNEVAADVQDPQTDVSVSERLRARRLARDEDERLTVDGHSIGALGSGSDWTPFLQHLGIASLNLVYSGEGGHGSYHSIFDSFDHYTRFNDPDFSYGIALAQTTGRAVLRLAEADVLPFEFERFGSTVETYLEEVTDLVETMRDDTERQNRLVRDASYELAADPTQTYVPPPEEEPVPYLNFAPLQNAVTELRMQAAAYGRAIGAWTQSPMLDVDTRDALNQILMRTERALTTEAGLPGRPWYRHQVYAPGFYTGYGVKTLPAVRESIEQRKWDQAAQHIDSVAATLGRFTDEVGKATALLENRSPR